MMLPENIIEKLTHDGPQVLHRFTAISVHIDQQIIICLMLYTYIHVLFNNIGTFRLLCSSGVNNNLNYCRTRVVRPNPVAIIVADRTKYNNNYL